MKNNDLLTLQRGLKSSLPLERHRAPTITFHNLVPRVSHLPTPEALWAGEMRDPGNEVELSTELCYSQYVGFTGSRPPDVLQSLYVSTTV